ncbi:NUDIX domain-containing protein [Longispora sp. K20-0274]|uniref:NUDIX hydrolase n=1 Tax=Longispora sp. K20-0274 TaxID=3088255 RepID=UPI00399B6005
MVDYARRTARVLLLDAADRLLLVRSEFGPDDPRGHGWFTPGGGIDDGEDVLAAAVRELDEEVGLRAAPGDLRHVAVATGRADLGWANGLFRDDFYLHRVDRHEVDTSGLTEFEWTHQTGFRWWTAAELAATDEAIFPRGLAELLPDLIAGRLPDPPAALTWHH